MTIVNTVNVTLHRSSARFMGGISKWMADSARSEIGDIQQYQEDIFSTRAEARVKRLEFNEALARSNSGWNSQLVEELGNYDPGQDKGGYILKALILRNDISRFREMKDIYEKWVSWESGRSMWNGEGPTNKVKRERDRILRNLGNVENGFARLESEMREANPEMFREGQQVADVEVEEGTSSLPTSVPVVKGPEDH